MEVSKGEFARMVGRVPSAISGWIADGKLTAPALVGTGRLAKVNVQAALAQLGLTLDVGQQLAQPRPVHLAAGDLFRPPGAAQPANDDAARLMRAKADQAELDLATAKAKAATMDGFYLVAAEAREAWTAEAAGFIHAVESWLLTGAPQDLAAIETRDVRTIGATLKAGFRALCDRIADRAEAPPADPAEDDELEEAETE